jgi:hypothetical protein
MKPAIHLLEGREIEISKTVANQPRANTISTHGPPSSRALSNSTASANSPPVPHIPLSLQLGANRAQIHPGSWIPHAAGISSMYASINAACNRITSIESMVRMEAPLLEDINLRTEGIIRRQSDPQRAGTQEGMVPSTPGTQHLYPHSHAAGNPIRDPSPLIELPSRELRELHVER